MAANYVLLAKNVVGAAGASSVTFSNIPQTGYTDLVVKAKIRTNHSGTSDLAPMAFNGGPTGTSYSNRTVYGDYTAAYSGSSSSGNSLVNVPVNGGGSTANTFSNTEWYIPNYTSSEYKSISVDTVGEGNSTSANYNYTQLTAGLWANTSAITSIYLSPYFGSLFSQYSTFYLYGVAKLGTTPAIAPYATGGDVVTTDGTYWYHTFNSSGTFTPRKALTCDYLVVAGGGGSGNTSTFGGGGAGGLRSTVTATGGGGSLESALSLASGTGYTVTIGAGGTNVPATNGNDSVFSTITSTGGGKGGVGGAGQNAGNGGSGGGAAYQNSTRGTGTANQGYNGGTGGTTAPNYGSGGGGGAGGVGTNGTSGAPGGGNGGVGVAVAITGTSVYYAGGGGGNADAGTLSSGGLGGGGKGGNPGGGTGGTANTGGGAGAGNGGSGIVIVRYAV